MKVIGMINFSLADGPVLYTICQWESFIATFTLANAVSVYARKKLSCSDGLSCAVLSWPVSVSVWTVNGHGEVCWIHVLAPRSVKPHFVRRSS